MRVLVLWADDSSSNLGLRAIGAGAEVLIRRTWPDADIHFHNFGARAAPVAVGSVRSAVRERVTSRGGLVDWLASFDLVVDTRSGDSFTNIYGQKRLTTMSLMADAVHRAGVTLVMAPQTVGPFGSRLARAMARHSLGQAASVMVRDSESASVARSLGRCPDVVATDMVFALPVPETAKSRDVLVNVSGLLWAENPYVPHQAYRHAIRTLIAQMTSSGRQVSLLAHVIDSPSRDNDVPGLRSLATEGVGALEVVVPSDLPEVRSIIASAHLTVGSRMHACLNSLSVGTPAIALAYSRKFVPLMRDLGWDAAIDLRTSRDPVGEVMHLVGDAPSLQRRTQATLDHAHGLLLPVVDALRALA